MRTKAPARIRSIFPRSPCLRICLGFFLALLPLAVSPAGDAAPAGTVAGSPVRFNRDIRPILSSKCFFCHGPDSNARKAGLRLDRKDGLFSERKAGKVVEPGKLDDSVLFARITTESASKRMPPESSKKSLSPGEVELFRRWIEEGAPWQDHWAFVTVERPPVSSAAGAAASPVDRFLGAKLAEVGLAPAPEADPITLCRRIYLDLTGLPPEPAEVDAFLADRSPEAWPKLVDRLLGSPRYGERMAQFWLDLVRYADTIGLHSDNPREVWLYRDWVIRAFNQDMPFDRFTILQIAGDLLPGAGVEEKIASGYNRLNLTTQEGGAQPKEYEAKYLADRVRNVGAAWLGATIGCAECHDHKYDPYTSRDFYSMGAFFADVGEVAVGEPVTGILPVPDEALSRELASLDGAIGKARSALDAPDPRLLAEEESKWEEAVRRDSSAPEPEEGRWRTIGPFPASSFDRAFDKAFGPESEEKPTRSYEGGKLRWTLRPDWTDGPVFPLPGENSATYLFRRLTSDRRRELTLSLGSDDGIRVWVNGKEVLSKKVMRAAAPDQERVAVTLEAGENRVLLKVVNAGGEGGFSFRLVRSAVPAELAAVLGKAAGERSAEETARVMAHFRTVAPTLKALRDQIAALEAKRAEAMKRAPTTLIAVSMPPRTVRILPRGNWLDESGEVVGPAVPRHLPALGVEGRRPTRLDLARWILSRENPLTARVLANRLWKLFFGRGLARPLDDLGAQGDPPTHPELLDWLASDLQENGWDVKRLVRILVLTDAYRRSSVATAEARERDPENKWLARQSSWRLDAEAVRDLALSASGLLSPRIGGPSVKPYQPAGYWSKLNFPTRDYVADHGESLYRRGLYTFWQRTFLHPSLLAFDAPSREDCKAERARSNTPVQALVLLDDPTYVEAARVLAERALREGGAAPLTGGAKQRGDSTDRARIVWAFRRALARVPQDREAQVLAGILGKHREEYGRDEEAARKLLGVGERPAAVDILPAELAAWTSVARVILNLHETITRS